MRKVVVNPGYHEQIWEGFLHKIVERDRKCSDGYGKGWVEKDIYGIIENNKGQLRSVLSKDFKFKYPYQTKYPN